MPAAAFTAGSWSGRKAGRGSSRCAGCWAQCGRQGTGPPRIPVAVAQQLHTLGLGRSQTPHLGVGVNGVAHIARLPAKIRRRDPGGAALGAAVRKNFIAADFKPAAVLLPELRQPGRLSRHSLSCRSSPATSSSSSPARAASASSCARPASCKAVLRRGDAVAQVSLLAPAQQLPRPLRPAGMALATISKRPAPPDIGLFPRLVPADPPAPAGRAFGGHHLPRTRLLTQPMWPPLACPKTTGYPGSAASKNCRVGWARPGSRCGRNRYRSPACRARCCFFFAQIPAAAGDLVKTVGAGQVCILQVICKCTIWLWASIKPGSRARPSRSTGSAPGARAAALPAAPHRRNALPHQHRLRAHARLVHGEHRAAVKQFFPFLVQKNHILVVDRIPQGCE